jgi:hypothetical protein
MTQPSIFSRFGLNGQKPLSHKKNIKFRPKVSVSHNDDIVVFLTRAKTKKVLNFS